MFILRHTRKSTFVRETKYISSDCEKLNKLLYRKRIIEACAPPTEIFEFIHLKGDLLKENPSIKRGCKAGIIITGVY